MQAGQGVELAQKADDRLARAEAAGEGGLNPRDGGGDLKALLLQRLDEHMGGGVFRKGQLRIFPYLVRKGIEKTGFLVEKRGDCFFIHRDFILSF